MVVVAPVAGILADAWGIRPTLLVAAAVRIDAVSIWAVVVRCMDERRPRDGR
jgi:hypothetical protein